MQAMEQMPVWAPHEEEANSITHLFGVAIAGAFLVLLYQEGKKSKNTYKLVGNLIFGWSMLNLYICSTVYHGMPAGTLKKFCRYLDHCSVYLLIAGSYTPMTLTFLRPTTGWYLLIFIWGLALSGIAMKILRFDGVYDLTAVIYLIMGWLIIFSLKAIKRTCSKRFIFWLFAGGLSYTAGTFFYSKDQQIPFFHAIFHLFVLGGSFSHGMAILNIA